MKDRLSLRRAASLYLDSAGRVVSAVLLFVSATATAAWAVYAVRPEPAPLLVIVVLSFVPLGLVAGFPPLRRGLSPCVVAALTAGLLTFAVLFGRPGKGADLYVYAAYGRTIVVHHDNPYVHPPSDYPNDPWVKDLTLFRNGRTFYGPLWIGITGVVAAMGGDSHVAVRLAYQLGAALAVAMSLFLLARAGVPPVGLMLIGLNPVVILEVVNQGRMDALVGLGLLAGVLLAGRGRLHLAAVAIAAAALIKIPAGLALIALVAWACRRHGVRKAGAVAATGTGMVAVFYLAAGGLSAVRPLLDASNASNDISIWVPIRNYPHGFARALGDTSASLGAIGSIPTIASIAAIVLGALLLAPHLDDRRPDLALALPVLAYLLTSPYPSSWYVGWVLPLLAVRPRSRAALVTLALFAVLMVWQSYSTAVHVGHGARTFTDFAQPVANPLLRSLHAGVILLEVAAIAVLAVQAVKALRHTSI